MSDKRTVSTDALATLGTIITEGGRDAIHLAVEPVEAGEQLYPGQHIGLFGGKASTKAPVKLGIVDPFITGFIPEGHKFWLIVYPRTITSLRHVWSHPAFDEEKSPISDLSEEEKSKQWLMNYARDIDETYDHLMAVADSYQGDGYSDYIVQGGRFEGEITPEEFWDHYAIVRHNKNPKRESFFSCSC